MCWYCGSQAAVVSGDEPITAYEAALRCEIDMVSRQFEHRIKVDHIHFGGGTPTIMAPESFTDLIGSIRHSFFVLPSAEIVVETEPRSLTRPMIDALALGGVNRASLGVHSFDPVIQRAINRVQSFEETAAATRALRRAGIGGINFDLVYGLPYQTVASCLDTIRRSVELRPDRFAIFGYEHHPSFTNDQRKIDQAWLPDGFEKLDQSNAIANALTEAGYLQVDLDHFALPGDAMAMALQERRLRRNFEGHATDADNILLGFGASAIGHLPQGYVQNEVGTRGYEQAIANHRLATVKGHALTDDGRLQSAPRLQDLISDGIVELDGTALAVTDDSRFLVRGVAAAVDAHLDGSEQLRRRAV
jgi:oxygen-independent coproporphyrinogen-3 oxidase